MAADSNASRCLAICPLFEAELLLALMLEKWRHPNADDESFRFRKRFERCLNTPILSAAKLC